MKDKKLGSSESRDRLLLSLRNRRKGFGGGVVGMAVLAIVSWNRPETWTTSAAISGVCLIIFAILHRRIRKLEQQT